MQLFYTPNISGQQAIFQGEEARHCAQVLRKKTGDAIQFVDGKGNWYEGILESVSKKECYISIQKEIETYNSRGCQIHVAIAPTKNIARFEWFLEKATEIGIDKISPIKCARSERKIIKNQRLNKILISAMKQSLKATLPQLDELKTFKQWLSELTDTTGQRFIAHCIEEEKVHLKEKYKAGQNVLLMIGPEGDFTKEEVTQAIQKGFLPVTLGESRLRTETAGIVGTHILNLINT